MKFSLLSKYLESSFLHLKNRNVSEIKWKTINYSMIIHYIWISIITTQHVIILIVYKIYVNYLALNSIKINCNSRITNIIIIRFQYTLYCLIYFKIYEIGLYLFSLSPKIKLFGGWKAYRPVLKVMQRVVIYD